MATSSESELLPGSKPSGETPPVPIMLKRRTILVAGIITVVLAVFLVFNMDMRTIKPPQHWRTDVVNSSGKQNVHRPSYNSVVTEITAALDKPLHNSCSARFPQDWDDNLPRRSDEARWSQCLLPSPPANYTPRPTEWADDEPWRKTEAEKLSKAVRQEFHKQQNPSNCSSARVLLCSFDQSCGMGCKLHHVVHCFALAYASRRMMLMVDSGRPYQTQSWWGTHFLPLSDTCNLSHFKGVKVVEWTEATGLGPDTVVRVPLIGSTRWVPALYPMAVPRHLAGRLFRIHCAPHAWWIGQLLSFITRLAPKVQALLDQTRAKIGFKSPIVGVQVRHSPDKWPEAAPLPLEQFLPHVQIAARYHGFGTPPRVFLATDDPKAIQKTKARSKDYQWVLNESGTRLADPRIRYSSQSLDAAIVDMFLLSETDYLICTLTSNLCRAAYELMQTRFGDASWRVTSLDQPYYFHGQLDFTRTARQDHVTSSKGEVVLKEGDPVAGLAPRDRVHCQGSNLRSGQQGLYLASKVRLQTPVQDFPPLRLNRPPKT